MSFLQGNTSLPDQYESLLFHDMKKRYSFVIGQQWGEIGENPSKIKVYLGIYSRPVPVHRVVNAIWGGQYLTFY